MRRTVWNFELSRYYLDTIRLQDVRVETLQLQCGRGVSRERWALESRSYWPLRKLCCFPQVLQDSNVESLKSLQEGVGSWMRGTLNTKKHHEFGGFMMPSSIAWCAGFDPCWNLGANRLIGPLISLTKYGFFCQKRILHSPPKKSDPFTVIDLGCHWDAWSVRPSNDHEERPHQMFAILMPHSFVLVRQCFFV